LVHALKASGGLDLVGAKDIGIFRAAPGGYCAPVILSRRSAAKDRKMAAPSQFEMLRRLCGSA